MITLGKRTFTVFCFAIIIASVVVAGSQVMADSVLNPTTYTSLSGHYGLFVDPSAMNGSGPATYRLTHDGEEVWADEHPFSLWKAKVTDNGTVVGYAYEGGATPPGNHGTGYNGLSIIILAPDGRVLLRDPATSHKADVAKNFSAGDSPSVSSFLIDQKGDRLIVCIPLENYYAGSEASIVWWTYQMSTGEKTGDIVPDFPTFSGMGFQHEIFIEVVPDTPLTLVHSYIHSYTNDKKMESAALTLLDPKGEQVWSFDFPGEYNNLGKGWNWYRDMVERGIVQTSVDSLCFSFRSYSLSSRLSFFIDIDNESDSGWRVVEAARVEDHLPVETKKIVAQPDIESTELEQVGVIELKIPATEPSPIKDIYDFAIDHAGNIGFAREDKSGTTRFIRVDPTGEILSNFALDLPKDEEAGWPRVVPVSNDRWLLMRESRAKVVGTRAWWIDADTGELDLIERFTSGRIESLVPTGDGGFITLASRNMEYTIEDEINRYDREGRLLWNQQGPDFSRGCTLQAATWVEDIGVATLSGISDTIEFFDMEGKHQRSINLDDILDFEPNYVTGLTTDLNGGLILHDFNGTPPIYRINAQGSVITQFQPRFPDGRVFRISGDVQVAPDGTLWTSDQHSLLRLNKEGVVDKIIGYQPDNDTLDEILAMTIDSKGNIYAVNERTAAVHVFDNKGEPLRICRPRPTDFATDGGIGSITVDGDGNIYYETGAYINDHDRGYLGLSAQCDRIGFNHLGLDWITEEWRFKPGSRERWVLGYHEIYLLDADGKVTKTIKRRPNRNWLQNVQDGAVASDGSLAAIACPRDWGVRGSAELCIYDGNGGPIRTIPLAEDSIFARIAFNGSTVITVDDGTIHLYDVNGEAPRKFVLPEVEGQMYWFPFMSPDGTEVWMRAHDSMTLLRYKLP